MKPRKFNDLSQAEKNELIEVLTATNDMQQFWNVINNRFQLQTCIPNTVTKKIVSRSIVTLVLPMLNPITK